MVNFETEKKIFRGLKKDDSPAITGIQFYHNYIKIFDKGFELLEKNALYFTMVYCYEI